MKNKKMKKSAAVFAFAMVMLVIGGGFVLSNMLSSARPVIVAASEVDEDDNVTTLNFAQTIAAPTQNAIVPQVEETDNTPLVTVCSGRPAIDGTMILCERDEVIPIYYDGVLVGFEAHPDTETIESVPAPLLFNDSNELLEAIYIEMGNIMLPTYIPEGFSVHGTGIYNPRDDYPQHPEAFTDGCYKHLNRLGVEFSNGETGIWLFAMPFQPYTHGIGEIRRLTVNDLPELGYGARHVVVNGMNATIGRYSGLILLDIDSGLSDIFSDFANSAASYSGMMYQFITDLDSDVSEEDLIRMAESLVRILNLSQGAAFQ